MGNVIVGHTLSVGTAVQPNIQVKGDSASNYGALGVISSNNEMLGFVGVWSNNENYLIIAADPDNLRASSSIVFTNDGTETMRITSGGVLQANYGISFPNQSPNATSTSEILNGYEEGLVDITTLTDGYATFTQHAGFTNLQYTRIGRFVNVSGNLYNQTIVGTWTDPLRIPLPYTNASGDSKRSAALVALYNWGSSSDNITIIEHGASYAKIVSAGNGQSWGTVTTSQGFTAVINFTYTV